MIIYKKICKKNNKDNCRIIQDNTTIKSNSVISTSLISIASLSGIAVLAILYHGNEMVKMHKKDNDMSDMTDMSEDDMSLYE